MVNKDLNKYANRLVNAFLKNKIISPLPLKYTKKISEAQKLRRLCESKIKKPVSGFKAAGTGIPVLRKLKEKEPFYATVFKHNVLKNKKTIKINKFTMGIELEVCYLINRNFFDLKQKVTKKNIKKFITHIAPCIEVVGAQKSGRSPISNNISTHAPPRPIWVVCASGVAARSPVSIRPILKSRASANAKPWAFRSAASGV